MATWPNIEQIVGMNCAGFWQKPDICRPQSSCKQRFFYAKNAGNCISVLLDFKFFLGEYTQGSPPPANLELLVKRAVVWVLTVANMNKTNMAGGSEHGGREQNECLTRLLFKS